MEEEVPLTGGRVTPGVVRVGDTVRRPVTASSPFVAELLGDLRRQGFTGAPRHLGFDRAGREVLSWVPGRVPARFRRWTDHQVAAPVQCSVDLGYMAWTWCISSKPGGPAAAVQAAQVRVLADAYGLGAASRSRLVDAALERQLRNARWWHSHLARPSPRVSDGQEITERVRWSEREYSFTSAHRTAFDAALR